LIYLTFTGDRQIYQKIMAKKSEEIRQILPQYFSFLAEFFGSTG